MENALTLRLTLLCAGGTALSRSGGFPARAEPLDQDERRRAAAWRPPGGAPAYLACAPSAAARETAAALADGAVEEARLADIDHGAWAGLSFAEVANRDGAALASWLASPEKGAPDGESLAEVIARVAPWLAEMREREGRAIAVTHPMVVRAILAEAIGLPPPATMRIDLAPLGHVTLSFRGGWRLQALAPRRGGA